MSRIKVLTIAVLAPALVLVSTSARADNAAATKAFREGREALGRRDYEVACAKFRDSEEAEPSGGARLNLGDCALRKNDYVGAEKLYRGAALLSTGDKRAFALQRADAARALAGTLRLRWAQEKPAGGYVEVDGHAVEVPGDLAINPGQHAVRVVASGFPPEPQTIDVTSGDVAQIELAPLPVAAPVTAAPIARDARPASPSRASRSPVAYILLGLGGAAIVGGAVTGLVAKGATSDLDSKCNGQKPCDAVVFARSDTQDPYDKAKLWATVSTVCFIGGAVSLVAGGTLWLVTAPTPGGQTVALAGVF